MLNIMYIHKKTKCLHQTTTDPLIISMGMNILYKNILANTPVDIVKSFYEKNLIVILHYINF